MVMRKVFSGVLLLLSAPTAFAGDRLVFDVAGSEDSDGLRQHSEYVGFVHALPALGRKASVGLRVGYWHLAAPGPLQKDFAALRLDHERTLGPVDVALRAQQLASEDWSPTLGAANASWHVTPHWNLSAGAERDIVDTVQATQHEIRFDTYNASTDYRFGETFTVVGGVLAQDFSDGNHREGGLARLIWTPPALDGFNTQLRWRRLDADFRGFGYFSPDRFEERMLQLQYGHGLPGGKFSLTGVAGRGEQQVDRGEASAIFLAELRTRGWFTDHFGLEGRAGCSNVGDLNVRAAGGGYRYCYASFSLMRSL